jgi:hypothetical protein
MYDNFSGRNVCHGSAYILSRFSTKEKVRYVYGTPKVEGIKKYETPVGISMDISFENGKPRTMILTKTNKTKKQKKLLRELIDNRLHQPDVLSHQSFSTLYFNLLNTLSRHALHHFPNRLLGLQNLQKLGISH